MLEIITSVPAVAITITVVVVGVLVATEIPNLVRKALKKDENEQSKKLLADAIQGKVTNVEEDYITLSCFAAMEEDNATDSIEITIRADEIDETIEEGMELAI